jgi:probable phosphoglycerate mutase
MLYMNNNTTRLVVIRHGETEWNIQNRFQGHLDSKLTLTGIKQAEAIADSLEGEAYDVIYSSDLERASHTAEIIARKLNMRLYTEKELREINLGVMQGLKKDEFIIKYPEVISKYHADPDYVIPGGESKRQLYNRVTGILEKIVKKHKGHNILLIAHGGVLDCIIRYTFNIPLNKQRNFSLFNASINRFTIDKGEWKLESWGETSHMRDIPVTDDF